MEFASVMTEQCKFYAFERAAAPEVSVVRLPCRVPADVPRRRDTESGNRQRHDMKMRVGSSQIRR